MVQLVFSGVISCTWEIYNVISTGYGPTERSKIAGDWLLINLLLILIGASIRIILDLITDFLNELKP